MAGRRGKDESGATVVVFAVCALFLFVLAGMVVDLGFARDTKRQSQNASDAAALAAANKLYPSSGACTLDSPATPPCFKDAVAAAQDFAARNLSTTSADWTACSDPAPYYYPSGSTSCVSFTDNTLTSSAVTTPTKVRVYMPRRVIDTGLGKLAGVNTVTVSSQARAALKPGQARSCGLCILGTDTSSLGNGDVSVYGGSVFANGTIDTGPTGGMTADSPNTITTVGTCSGNCSPAATTGATPITDPYASSLTLPPAAMSALSVRSNPCTDGPGKYAAFTVGTNVTCTLTPGLYVFTGTFDLQANNSRIVGTNGVTIYGTCGTPAAPQVCTSGQSGGYLDTKVGDVQLVAPTTGALAGMAILYDRENVAGLNIQGNGNSYVTGTIYAPKAQLQFPGNSCVAVTNGPVIVGTLYGNGNHGCVNLNSVLGANLPAPPGEASLDQ